MNFKLYRYLSYSLCLLLLFTHFSIGKEPGEKPLPSITYTKVITKIKIEGQRYTPKKNMPSIINLQNKAGEKVIKRFIDADLKNIYKTGYFHKVYASTSKSDTSLTLTYHVIEHPVITKINIIGNASISSRKLIKQLKSKKSHPLNLKFIQEDIQKLDLYYKEKGYTLSKIVKVKLTNNQLNITINESPISEIQINGLTKIKPHIITRLLETQVGTAFNSSTLRRDRERLLRLGYFSNVSSPQLKQDINTNTLIIILNVTEKKANQIEIGIEEDGIGQESEKTVAFIKGVKNHLLIQSDSFSGKFQTSDSINLFNTYHLSYRQPWLFNRVNMSWSTDIWQEITQDIPANQQLNTQSQFIESVLRKGSRITFGFPLNHDILTLKTTGKREKITPQNSNSAISPYSMSSITTKLSYYAITSPFNPKRGNYWSIQYERDVHLGTLELPGIKFYRTILNIAKFIPISKKATLGLHANFGLFKSQENSQTTFETENFIMGGTYSLRGYDMFSGPRKVLFNIEYRQDIFKKLQYVIFYDIGNTFDTGFNINPTTLHKGYGIGIRYFTPVGPIRLDVAKGQNDYSFHFGLGQLF
jgi:outer membrane protein assembly factor BamA